MWNDNEFNSTFSSPGGNAGKDTKRSMIKYVVPMTCQTVNECHQVEGENSVFEYNHLRFNQICLIGLIRNVIKRANDMTYLIDDMTSRDLISVKLQADEPDDMETEESKPAQTYIEGQYVRVYGIIKSLQGQKNVQAFKIMPIVDLNEITHHMLECMNASIYYYAKANGESLDGTMTVGGAGGAAAHHQQTFAGGSMKASAGGSASNSGLSGFTLNLSNFIKQCKNSVGVPFKEICDNFSSIPKDKIRETLEFLSNEGQVYTTIDDEHFQSTEAMDN